ncbi:MAG: 16S rRNA (cytosine(1402)-N(4))-methyltransferase RsmH [bacterium]|nr:16S rRNA (cytosine(1402)-N(4))-methyltransferase RsmH [bacterium]
MGRPRNAPVLSIRHQPVLLEEVLGFLAADGGGCFVDCTLGLGGHAEALLERSTRATLVGIDRDPQALESAAARLSRFGERVQLVAGRFAELERLLTALGIERVSGVLADLGVSSLQLETAERGFSFMHDGPLDMRMGSAEGQEITAGEIVNRFPEETLRRILKEYGEERQAKRIARAIVERRRGQPLRTTGELAGLIDEVKPMPPRRRIHSATQTFQALRIEVNRELDELRALLEQAVQMLESKGRLVVISYHSLEDRIVKHTLRELATGKIEPVTGRPRAETQVLEVLTRKPVRPNAEEVAANPRSRSARLRAARRL